MTTFKAYHRSRAIRIAFLVEEHENYDAMLDAVFSNCQRRWGGRFNLVVPCKDGWPQGRYEGWLEAYDADVIYSYISLTEDSANQYHEKYGPSHLVRHEQYIEKGKDEYYFWPRLPIHCVSSLSTFGRLVRPLSFEKPTRPLIVDVLGDPERDRFIEDTFGTYSRAYQSFPFPRQLHDLIAPLTVVSPDMAVRQNGFQEEDETVSSASELLGVFAQNRSIITFAQLSASSVRRLELNGHEWSSKLAITVGDSFTDRISHWNSKSLFRTTLDDKITNVYLPQALLKDSDFLHRLGKFLRYRNHVSRTSGGNTPLSELRSSSVSQEELGSACQVLKEADSWSHYSTGSISSVEDCSPSEKILRDSRVLDAGGGFGSAIGKWTETTFENETLRFQTEEPSHVSYFPPTQFKPLDGAWAVDIALERRENHSRYMNQHHQTCFPRRLRLNYSYLPSLSLVERDIPTIPTRPNIDGDLTLFSSQDRRAFEIRVPLDEEAFQVALTKGRHWWPYNLDVEDTSGMPQQCCTYVEPSSQGRYLSGVIGLFGNLERASEVLVNSFWERLFDNIGATSKSTENRKSVLEQKVMKRLPRQIDFEDEKQREVLLNQILQEARHQRVEKNHWSWKTISEVFSEMLDLHYTDTPKSPSSGEPSKEEIARLEARKMRDFERFQSHLQNLCANRVLFQGYHRRCPKCFHRDWTSIRDLSDKNTCAVCSQTMKAPVQRDWDFMPNPFLVTALREHAVQSLVWTLDRLHEWRTNTFSFLGPSNVWLDVFPEDQDGPDGDIDLLVIVDQKVIACEVKQSSRDVGNLDNFIRIMQRVRPDIAMLSVMEPSNPKIDAAVQRLENELAPFGIQVRSMAIEENDRGVGPIFGLRRIR